MGGVSQSVVAKKKSEEELAFEAKMANAKKGDKEKDSDSDADKKDGDSDSDSDKKHSDKSKSKKSSQMENVFRQQCKFVCTGRKQVLHVNIEKKHDEAEFSEMLVKSGHATSQCLDPHLRNIHHEALDV